MKTPSLQKRITIITLMGLLITAIVSGILSFYITYDEISDISDDNLENIAIIIKSQNINQANIVPADNELDDDGVMVDIVPFNHQTDGFDNQMINGEQWRVYSLSSQGDKPFTIIARQKKSIQHDLAMMSALHSLLPLLAISAVLALLLPYLIWHNFHSVRLATKTITGRKPHDLSPIDYDNFPKELTPFIHSMNDLLNRANNDIKNQKRFIADASHELRSPLTAISLQAQRLSQLQDLDKIKLGLNKLNISIKKNQDLVESLLTLARVNNLNNNQINQKSDIKMVVTEIMNMLLPIIHEKQIDLSMDINSDNQTYDYLVNIDKTTLLLLIKNIIQNAINYTPKNGKILIALSHFANITGDLVVGSGKNHMANAVYLSISDSGAGIAPDDYDKAFKPFVRLDGERSDVSTSSGTGLGLSMVQSIAEAMGVDVYFGKSQFKQPVENTGINDKQEGLCVMMVFKI